MPDKENLDYRKFIEDKLENHRERIKGLELLSNEFTKISTILEMQIEMNKKQDITLEKINDNLTNLNHTTQQLGERVQKVEGAVDKVNENDSISVTGFLKKIGWLILSGCIGGIITWAFFLIRGN